MQERDYLENRDALPIFDGVCTVGRRKDYRVLRLFACGMARIVYGPDIDYDRERVIAEAEFVAYSGTPWGLEKKLLDARASIDAVSGWIWCATCPDISAGLRQTLYYKKESPPLFQASALRCALGNPFHPWTMDRRFVTETVLNLAVAAYTDTDWDVMPIIADALEEAGHPTTEPCPHCEGEGERWVSVADGGVEMGQVEAEDGSMRWVVGSGYMTCETCAETGLVPHRVLAHLRRPRHCFTCYGSGKVRQSIRKGGPENDRDFGPIYLIEPPRHHEVDCPDCSGDKVGPHTRACAALDLIFGR